MWTAALCRNLRVLLIVGASTSKWRGQHVDCNLTPKHARIWRPRYSYTMERSCPESNREVLIPHIHGFAGAIGFGCTNTLSIYRTSNIVVTCNYGPVSGTILEHIIEWLRTVTRSYVHVLTFR